MNIYTTLKTGVKSCFFVAKMLENPIMLEDEYNGKSNVIKDMCIESRDRHIVWVQPTILGLKGKMYHSAIVVDRGRLVGTTDMTHTRRDVPVGSVLTVHHTSIGNIGIMIDEDVGYFELGRELTLMGAGILLMLGGSSLMAEAMSLTNGVVGIHIGDSVMVYNALHTIYDDHIGADLKPILRGNIKYRRPELYPNLCNK